MLRSLRLAYFITTKTIGPRPATLVPAPLRQADPCRHRLDQTRAVTTAAMGVKIHIIYWPKFTKLKTLLEGEFPGDLEISGESTPTTSGWFEVEVNGKLVHSKKNGDGFVDSEQKMAKLVSAIEKAMDK
ncbi:hypothetical protein SRHO_G00288460 [Serrasalmus rhombeus]